MLNYIAYAATSIVIVFLQIINHVDDDDDDNYSWAQLCTNVNASSSLIQEEEENNNNNEIVHSEDDKFITNCIGQANPLLEFNRVSDIHVVVVQCKTSKCQLQINPRNITSSAQLAIGCHVQKCACIF